MTETKNYTNLEVDKKDNSEVEIKAQIPEEVVSKYKDNAVKKLGKNIKVDGFREGHIPENVLLGKIGAQVILEEQVHMALADIYPDIIKDEKLAVIGRPEVSITKLAVGNPVEFTIKTALMPEFTLPDYKKIAGEVELPKDVSVTDKELEVMLEQIKTGIAGQKKTATPEKEGVEAKEEKVELTDEFVKTLGDFKDLADFKVKIKENLSKEKEIKAKEKRRAEIVENIIKETEIGIPKILVESELDKMLAQFKDDVAKMNIKFEEYLEKIKKTEEGLREEWKNDAEKRAKFQLILNKISITEEIKVPEEEIEKEVKHILEHYKDAKQENVRVYIESVLTNEKVFQLLEEQK
jgi:FKBP-type peptidyl-prolyl cis-trans isomerase (trigger factor)